MAPESPKMQLQTPLAQLAPGCGETAANCLGTALTGDCEAAVAPDALPEAWVTRWVDYSAKYGVVYSLPDGSIGVYFNDSTKAIATPDGARFDYITRSTAEQPAVRSTHTFEDYPAELQKKATLLRHFRACMSTPDSIGRRDGATLGESNLPDRKVKSQQSQVFVRRWSKRGSAVMFQLSNKDTQVIFFDGTEVVLSSRAHMVTYCDKGGRTQSFAAARAWESPGPELARRLRYILSNFLDVPAAELPAALRQ